ncbi:hypothetical protein HID58_010169 [Brassica napus]|uniref:Uncharacterized protein n=2 Tax=Brassica TaxID=3705 RepID=A0ABQ8DVA2_BRANA|nr:hypothetical protein HID58_010169 [Brassica napus]
MQLKLDLRDRVDSLFRATLQAYNKGAEQRVKDEMPGLEYYSSTVGRLFKSGFGRFDLGQAKPSLADQSGVLYFFSLEESVVERWVSSNH